MINPRRNLALSFIVISQFAHYERLPTQNSYETKLLRNSGFCAIVGWISPTYIMLEIGIPPFNVYSLL